MSKSDAAKALSGNFSAREARPFLVGGKRHTFDGTSLGLTLAAHAAGIRVGQTVIADFGVGAAVYVMVDSGGGGRTPDGVWMDRGKLLNYSLFGRL